MKLSQNAWKLTENLYRKIHDHPFNRELATGTLDPAIFSEYLAQDSAYLVDFARCLAILAARVPFAAEVELFLAQARLALEGEREILHSFASKHPKPKIKGPTQARLGYSGHIFRCCTLETYAVGLASLLPCFWIYLRLGQDMLSTLKKDNPYLHWISFHSDEIFEESTHAMIELFDVWGKRAHDEEKSQMLRVFYQSTSLEWYFWNDCYTKKALDAF